MNEKEVNLLMPAVCEYAKEVYCKRTMCHCP